MGFSIDLANAVEYLHRAGISDLDLTSAGVLFSLDGSLKIDLSRTRDRRIYEEITPDGSLIVGGMTGCEAPELFLDQVDRNAQASDVYALGAILFEMLTGRVPLIRGAVDRVVKIQKILHADPQRPRLLNRNVDRTLESICLRCLRKDPADRFGSAASLAKELERWRERAERSGLIHRL